MNHFSITHQDPLSKARVGLLQTPHGVIETPVFMPVGTQASVKLMGADEMEAFGYRILLSNTYHLFLRPGLETLLAAGGLHQFMAWPFAILTDSGGYQVFSLASRCKSDERGVEFSSHVDGQRRSLTPEIATNFQLQIGSDISMCLDDCPPYPSLKADAEKSMELTLRWAERCKTTYRKYLLDKPNVSSIGIPFVMQRDNGSSSKGGAEQLLFGIVQGAAFADLRQICSRKMADIGFPGYAIGGLGLGEPRDLTWMMVEASLEALPIESPHYLMGFGQPEDMWEGVERGIDMFDCVLPTRNARNGQALTSLGRINISNAQFKTDFSSLDPQCDCMTCGRYSRAYLCHLFRVGELLGPKLLTLHNLWFMLGLLRKIRQSIIDGRFKTAKREFFQTFISDKHLNPL